MPFAEADALVTLAGATPRRRRPGRGDRSSPRGDRDRRVDRRRLGARTRLRPPRRAPSARAVTSRAPSRSPRRASERARESGVAVVRSEVRARPRLDAHHPRPLDRGGTRPRRGGDARTRGHHAPALLRDGRLARRRSVVTSSTAHRLLDEGRALRAELRDPRWAHLAAPGLCPAGAPGRSARGRPSGGGRGSAQRAALPGADDGGPGRDGG